MSDDVNARIEQLEAEVRALRAQVSEDQTEEAAEPAPERRLSRRALLGGAAAAGAGIAGATLSALPAGAAAPDPVLQGTANDAGTTNTGLTSTNAVTLTLSNGTSSNAPLNLAPSSDAGPPAAGAHTKGDLFVGSGGKIFICIASGTPGTWRPLAQVGATNTEGAANTTVFSNVALPAVELNSGGVANVAPLLITPNVNAGTPSGTHVKGEIHVDSAGKIYLCTNGGNPGQWRPLALVGSSNSEAAANPTVFTNSATAAIQVSAGGAADVPPLFIAPSTNAGPPASGTHSLGEVHIDSAGALYTCIGQGSPGTWARHAPFVPLAAPSRVYDSRVGQPNPSASPQGALAFGAAARTINCTPAVPTGATSILFNLTATQTAGAGSGALLVWAAGVTQPLASSINWKGAAQTIANAVTSGCNSSQDVQVRCVSSAGSSANFILDVIGYYV